MNKTLGNILLYLTSLCLLLFFSIIIPNTILAETPLPQEGKKSVFQRVVSHPGAILRQSSDPNSAEIKKPRTFTAFYVYENKGDMLRVGVGSSQSDGWIKASECTNWPQAITMVFTDPMGRQPVLFFKNHQEIQKACEAQNIKEYLDQYTTLFMNKARIPDDCPVIAMEPMGEQGSVSQENFYLLPVLNIDTQFKDSGTQLLQVACIDPGTPEKPKIESQMRTGIVFVIDTTISMKPYIDQTMVLVKKIYDRLQNSEAADRIGIAIVAFRSNLEKSPGIEYTTKVISDFKDVKDRTSLEKLLSQVEEASKPTHAFDEDSLAGVKEAVDSLSWDKYNSKAMLLVTDAGPLGAGDKTSKTGMSPDTMADYLHTNNIYLTTIHIKTPTGKKDHAYAEKSYKALSIMSNNRSSYVSIDAKNSKDAAKEFDKIGNIIAEIYQKFVEGEAKGIMPEKPKNQDPSQQNNPEELAKYIAEVTGYAMRLQFAGTSKKTTAPSVVNAWIADSDLVELENNPNAAAVPSVYPAVLLTKSQLSQLRKQLKTIVQTAEEAFLRTDENFNFYEQLVSAAAQMSRDPTQFSKDPNANLAQLNLLPEVLEGLPYKSRVLGLKQEDWTNMSTGEQREFIKRLQGLLNRYEEYDKDNEHWEGFGEKNPLEWVYRIPLTMLP